MQQSTQIDAPKGLFTFYRGALITEASDLQAMNLKVEYRLANTINVNNPRTGKSLEFYFASFDKHDEEIYGFKYMPTDPDKAFEYGVKYLLIIND